MRTQARLALLSELTTKAIALIQDARQLAHYDARKHEVEIQRKLHSAIDLLKKGVSPEGDTPKD